MPRSYALAPPRARAPPIAAWRHPYAINTPPAVITANAVTAPATKTAPIVAANESDQPVAAGNGEVAGAVEAWASAWSKKDVKVYLSYYAKDFATPKGESRSAWDAERHKRIVKPGNIRVSVDNLKITMEGSDRATARFRQHYQSASLKSSSNKVLALVKRDGKWQIRQERIGK